MDKEEEDRIEWESWNLLVDIFPNGIPIPVDLTKIGKYFGLNILEGKFRDGSVSGIYYRDHKTICVRKEDNRYKKMFMVAHKMAHYILHRNKSKEVSYRFEEKESIAVEEQEANLFAISLLIPRVILKEYIRKYRAADYFEIASSFLVSREKTKNRLNFLDIKL